MMQTNVDVMTKIVDDVKRNILPPIIEANVKKQSEIQTDELHSYKGLNQKGYTHNTVNQGAGKYNKLRIYRLFITKRFFF